MYDLAVCLVAVDCHLCRTLSTTNKMMHVPMIEAAITPNTCDSGVNAVHFVFGQTFSNLPLEFSSQIAQ